MTTSQIVEKFSLFLDQKISLEKFEDWLMSEVWNSDEENVCETASELILRFFEYSSKHLSRDELIAEIKGLLPLQRQEAPFLSLWDTIVEGSICFSVIIHEPVPRAPTWLGDRLFELEFSLLELDPDSHQTSRYQFPQPQSLLPAH